MKTLKKAFAAGIVTMMSLTAIVAARGPVSELCYSSYGYLGSATYQASAYFKGDLYDYGGTIYGVSGCSVTQTSRSATKTSVTVYGSLYAPNNYGVSVNRTVYGY